MQSTNELSNLQLELLKIYSFDVSEVQLKEIKQLLANYFADQITNDMDRLFEKKKWNSDIIKEWSEEHMRTKYEQ